GPRTGARRAAHIGGSAACRETSPPAVYDAVSLTSQSDSPAVRTTTAFDQPPSVPAATARTRKYSVDPSGLAYTAYSRSGPLQIVSAVANDPSTSSCSSYVGCFASLPLHPSVMSPSGPPRPPATPPPRPRAH